MLQFHKYCCAPVFFYRYKKITPNRKKLLKSILKENSAFGCNTVICMQCSHFSQPHLQYCNTVICITIQFQPRIYNIVSRLKYSINRLIHSFAYVLMITGTVLLPAYVYQVELLPPRAFYSKYFSNDLA